MDQNNLNSDFQIHVCLSAGEWELLVEETFIDDDLTNSVVTDGNNKYINWSADDVDCVLGYLAEAANHVENKLTLKRLDKLINKIEKFEKKCATKCSH